MDRNFAKSLKLVLRYEGGYVNHPADPGGPTNKGITLTTFRRYVKRDAQIPDLKAITDAQVGTVYRKQYWDAVKGDDLPDGVDFATFDFGVNSGPSRALKYLVKARRSTPADTVKALCDARLDFMKGLEIWPTFRKGWSDRVASVRAEGVKMAASTKPAALATITPIEAKPAPAPLPATDSSIVEAAQKRLTELKYNPGGADGKIGPLTAGAIRVFRADNGLPEGDFIDGAFLTALATAKPREMVPERANATATQVAAVVPEAKAHSWNKIVALGSGAVTAAGGALDQIAPATGYLQPVKDFLGDIPTSAWIAAIVLVAGLIWWNARAGQKAADEAYRAGDRR